MLEYTKKTLKRHWHELARHAPGARFYARYIARHGDGPPKYRLSSLVTIGVGLLLTAIGLVMLVTPGPGVVFLVLGLAALGSEFRPIARFMDWAELRLRSLLRALRHWWHKAGTAARVTAIVSAVAISLAIIGGFCWLVCL